MRGWLGFTRLPYPVEPPTVPLQQPGATVSHPTLTNTLTKYSIGRILRSMSRQVNLYEAKTQLSRLVEEAANGDAIIIAKDGKPMAKLGPV